MLPVPQQLRRAASDNVSTRYSQRREKPSYHPEHAEYLMFDLDLPREYNRGYPPPPDSRHFETEAIRREERQYLEEQLTHTHELLSVLEQDESMLTDEIQRYEMKHQTSVTEMQHKKNEFNQVRSTNVDMMLETEQKKRERLHHRAGLLRNTKVAPQIREHASLKQNIDDLKNKNNVLTAMIEITEKDLNKRVQFIQQRLGKERAIADDMDQHNTELQRQINELKHEKETLQRELSNERRRTDEEPTAATEAAAVADEEAALYREYPPESTVISNLLQAQVEFYFSDYNLKRDKRLLEEVCDGEGFLPIDKVMGLARIRQLCSEKSQLIDALRRSTILTLKEGSPVFAEVSLGQDQDQDEAKEAKEESEHGGGDSAPRMFVGREGFERPAEKEFPFRRTVFLFGLRETLTEADVRRMLAPFGTLNKVAFDTDDSFDRRIGRKFLEKPRVYTVFSKRGHFPMVFRVETDDESVSQIMCGECNKAKPVDEGYYEHQRFNEIMCAQCGAGQAEEQVNTYHKNHGKDQLYYLGNVPPSNALDRTRTALVVFSSQRQASKCAYVRARIGDDGMFATHYHHYSKVKRDSQSDDGKPKGVTRRRGRGMAGRDAPHLQRQRTAPTRSYRGRLGAKVVRQKSSLS